MQISLGYYHLHTMSIAATAALFSIIKRNYENRTNLGDTMAQMTRWLYYDSILIERCRQNDIS